MIYINSNVKNGTISRKTISEKKEFLFSKWNAKVGPIGTSKTKNQKRFYFFVFRRPPSNQAIGTQNRAKNKNLFFLNFNFSHQTDNQKAGRRNHHITNICYLITHQLRKFSILHAWNGSTSRLDRPHTQKKKIYCPNTQIMHNTGGGDVKKGSKGNSKSDPWSTVDTSKKTKNKWRIRIETDKIKFDDWD